MPKTKKQINSEELKINPISKKGQKVLVIVESPAKAKTIAKYLTEAEDGSSYTVVASVGHVRDLPKNNKKAIDIPGGFIPHYEISAGKENVIANIRDLAKKSDVIYLATDPDREGEAIAWHVAQAVGLKNPQRVAFYEITKLAVQEAIKHPRLIDENLKEAQEARRVLDRLVGYDLSGLIWKKVRYGLSAGRVQSPALRIIVEREREIKAFNPEEYFVITSTGNLGSGKNDNKNLYTFNCVEEPKKQNEAERIVKIGQEGVKTKTWKVVSVNETKAKRSPKPPFTTSTLQQAASSRLGFSPSRTMGLAQRLYESGHITYMRTDSTNISSVALKDIASYGKDYFGSEFMQPRTWSSKSKNAQEAHEAIRPTSIRKLTAGTDDSQKKLYELIWARTMASCMSDAELLRTKISANTEGSIPDFTINGSQILFHGWIKADPDARGEDVILPAVKEGEKIDMKEVISEQKFTEPPSRYSEAGLIKELEKRGIGRPSTYASIISTIENRGYVEKINKALKPTDTGEVVSTFLEENFGKYISDSFTAEMEDKLDTIAEGNATYKKVLTDFYGPFTVDLKAKDSIEKITNLGDADPSLKCPKCASPMVIKLGKGGKFLSCSRFPDCDGSLTLDGKEVAPELPIGIDPETGLGVFIKIGKYGPYVQLGENVKKEKKVKKVKAPKKLKGEVEVEKEEVIVKAKPKMASIPKTVDPSNVTLDMALTYLTLPRDLGMHPVTGKKVIANVGMFGPYVMHDGDFRSLKKVNNDDPYTITFARALEILAEEKKARKGGFRFKKK